MRKNTLITGASSGLGAGMARHLAASGHHLALTARRVDRMEALRGELLTAHPAITVTVHELDVTDPDRVRQVFAEAADALGGLDRVVVNAGLGKGGRIGTGRDEANRQTMITNVLGALAQCEAAMSYFYERKSGHLVVVSSMSAMRGMPSSMTAYSASKAAVAQLAEGIRSDLLTRKDCDITVTTLYPGYIESEMNAKVEQKTPLMTSTEEGTKAMVAYIEKEIAEASVPAWPWMPLGFVMRHAPLSVVRKLV